MCDEFRQALDAAEPPPWSDIQASALAAVERLARLKKTGGAQTVREPVSTVAHAHERTQEELAAYWRVPCLLGRASPDEFRILGQGLGLDGSLICHIQRELQVRTDHSKQNVWESA